MVKDHGVNDAANWVWSSYRQSVGLALAASSLSVAGLLSQFAGQRELAQQHYGKVCCSRYWTLMVCKMVCKRRF